MSKAVARAAVLLSAFVLLVSCVLRPPEMRYRAYIRKAHRSLVRHRVDPVEAIPSLRFVEERILELKSELASLPSEEAWRVYDKVEEAYLGLDSYVRNERSLAEHPYVLAFLNRISP